MQVIVWSSSIIDSRIIPPQFSFPNTKRGGRIDSIKNKPEAAHKTVCPFPPTQGSHLGTVEFYF